MWHSNCNGSFIAIKSNYPNQNMLLRKWVSTEGRQAIRSPPQTFLHEKLYAWLYQTSFYRWFRLKEAFPWNPSGLMQGVIFYLFLDCRPCTRITLHRIVCSSSNMVFKDFINCVKATFVIKANGVNTHTTLMVVSGDGEEQMPPNSHFYFICTLHNFITSITQHNLLSTLARCLNLPLFFKKLMV